MNIPHYARNLRRHAVLFEGATAGLYTLPADLLSQRAAIMRLIAEQDAITGPDVPAIETEHVAALIAAAKSGRKTLPDSTTVHDAEANVAHADRRSALLIRAVESADTELGGIVTDQGDRIIRDHLAPAIVEVMTGVTAAAELLPVDASPETLLRAPEEARQAWFTVGDLAARYDAVRRAAAAARRNDDQPQYDTRGDFAELYNFHEITAGMNIQIGGARPWPTDSTASRLLWYVRHGGEVWLPTTAQMDQRYHSVHKGKIDQMAENRARLGAARAAFG